MVRNIRSSTAQQGTQEAFDCPYIQYASPLIIELFEDDNQYSVRVSFNDKYQDVCDGDFTNAAEFKCNY